jgi:hypothetical protein
MTVAEKVYAHIFLFFFLRPTIAGDIMTRVLFGLIVSLSLICMNSARAVSTQAWMDCFTSEKWCLLNESDQITKRKFKNVYVSAKEPIFFHGSARVDLLLMCVGLKPWAYIETVNPVTYRELRVRYRVDPSGKIGYAVATHVRSGNLFKVRDSVVFLRDIQNGKKLTAEFTDPLDGSNSTTTFNIERTNAMMGRMDCAKEE